MVIVKAIVKGFILIRRKGAFFSKRLNRQSVIIAMALLKGCNLFFSKTSKYYILPL
jgi:hypothetical protein